MFGNFLIWPIPERKKKFSNPEQSLCCSERFEDLEGPDLEMLANSKLNNASRFFA